jgi:hypothetical protein
MFHACLCTICFVFCYTSWHFYAFSGTNLLMRCHSASSLFSPIFVFQKSYTGNILGIGWNKSRTSYFSRTKDKDRRRAGEGLGSSHTRGGAPPPGRARGWCGPPGHPLTPPLSLYKAFWLKTLNQLAIFQKKSCSSTVTTDKFQGIEVSVLAHYRDGKVPPEPSPSTPSPPPPSPSTSPPYPSTLLSPMMRRE